MKEDYRTVKNRTMNNLRRRCVAALALLGVCAGTRAALPPDFPQLSILLNTNPAPGYLFGGLSVSNVPGYSNYFAILDNDGSPILLNKADSLGELACNGLFVSAQGKTGHFLLKDSSFNLIATNQAGNGYVADDRDFQLLPNGHALILIDDSTPVVDMSKVIPGGYRAALVTQAIIQEVDVDGAAVFQWRSLDHIPVTDSYEDLTAPELDYIHANSLWFDETDGNIILSCRNTSEVIKISRVTGDIVWRMQGKHNQFTFTNAILGNSDPAYFQAQHHARRLPNGNLTIFDNGNSAGSDPAYDFTRPYSRAVEYVIAETSKTARLVWQYRHSPDIITYNGGSVDRLPGGHTIIRWGNDNTASPGLAMTEVDTDGSLACELTVPQAGVSGNFTRVLWPIESSYVTVTKRELAAGNSYGFNEGATNVTGVTMYVSGMTGDQYNIVTVSSQPFAPVLPRFPAKAPRVVKARLEITSEFIDEMTAVISFDASKFDLRDPTNTTVYYRPTPGQGLFLPLPTEYNWVTQQLQAYMDGFGEFIFGFDDLAEVPFPPLPIAPTSNAAVNQELPVCFSWTPKGFAGSYALQVSTNASFSNPDVDIPFQTEARYTFTSARPNTTYYWRVNTSNAGGVSVWATNSFRTVPPVPFTVGTTPDGLNVTVDGTNYTAPVVFNWLAGSAHVLDTLSLQMASDGHSRSIFGAWSDGGAQTHVITVPGSSTNYMAAFFTQYLLDATVAPASAGTISNYPAGPWYDAGQSVALTARTNTGYRVSAWQGVDSQSGATAQVAINGYRSVQANFVPSTFPYIAVTNSGAAAPGNLIGNIGGRNADGTKTTYLILDNTGTSPLYSSTSNVILRFGTPQGYVVDNTTSPATFRFKDETLTNVADNSTTSGYPLDTHDIKLFPNGHSLVFGTEVRTFDMSGVVANGKTAAAVTGGVIQEFDADKRLVFEWHTFDYIAITNTFSDMSQSSFDYAHVNAMTIDPTDNNLLVSLRTTSEIVKINRRTGEVLWRLGGKVNQFTFVNEHEENAPFYKVGQHDVHRLANGNLLLFDNGNISGGGVTPNDRTYSRAVEYALDETNMTATLVWEYRHAPDISTPCTGSVKRMANGNTLIDWGCAVPTSGYIITEVNPEAQIVFEMKHRTNNGVGGLLLGAGLTKELWNSPDLVRSATYQGIQAGQTYNAVAAGVAVTVNSFSGRPDNTLLVERHLDAVRLARFAGKAPQVTVEHVVLSGSNIASLELSLDFNLPDTSHVFDTPMIHDPNQVVVYQRTTPGQGQFTALPTTYDSGTRKVRVVSTQLGEFIFGYPDVGETPLMPAILSPVDQSEINQAAPVTMTWVPRGLVGSFDLELATDAAFANLVLNTNGLGATSYQLTNPAPNTQYYWRVRTVNQGGVSDWASASFSTVPPLLQLTYPAGGEVWQRFQVVTIRWIDNLSENVALDLYKGGVSNRTIAASTASSGAYTWTVGQFAAIPPGTDYTIKIRSTTNPALFDFSQPFNIIQPVTMATVPAGLSLTVDGTNYTAPAAFAWAPDSSHLIGAASPQLSGDGHSRYLFGSWSDGGAQNHSITAPLAGATITASFSTNYLLDITVTPPAAATVAAGPPGPWYAPGQLVSLTAQSDTDYLIYTWQGVDAQMGDTAQLTMDRYHAVEAKFIPLNGVPAIQTGSMMTLPDGRVQFTLTAGAGLATQATVWGATRLTPPDWKVLATVPLTNGQSVFTDSTAPTVATRFYRITLP